MAADHSLAVSASPANRAGTSEAVLRLYTWARPTVSFGRNEPVVGIYDPELADSLGVSMVRRPTGGRAVLHDLELTYSVALPIRSLGGARAIYGHVNEALVDAVRRLGAVADLSGPPQGGVLPLEAGPCFQSPAEGEVIAAGRKLVGSAQARIGGAFLQHGSIILQGDQSLLSTLGAVADSEQPAMLFDQIGPVESEIVADAVVAAMKKVFGGTWVESEYSGGEKRMIEDLVENRYGSGAWTWRR